MIRPALDEALRIDEGLYDIVPISTELFADEITPIALLRKLKKISSHCFILESAEDSKRWGRYTFLGFDPKLEITALNGDVKISSKASGETKLFKGDNPNGHIQKILDNHRGFKFDYLPPFAGGLVGYFAYDYAKYSEPTLDLNAPDRENFQDVDLMLFDKVIAFDHYRQKIILIVNINVKNIKTEYERGVKAIAQLKDIIENGKPDTMTGGQIKSEFKALFTKDEYCSMVGERSII